jgi:hypothetical protein
MLMQRWGCRFSPAIALRHELSGDAERDLVGMVGAEIQSQRAMKQPGALG